MSRGPGPVGVVRQHESGSVALDDTRERWRIMKSSTDVSEGRYPPSRVDGSLGPPPYPPGWSSWPYR